MKTFFCCTIIMCAFYFTSSASRIIKNPSIEFQKSGITYVTQVELRDTATLVTFQTRFIPHWWISFSEKDYLKDCDSDEKYYMTGLIGGKMDDHIFMGDSGDSTFVGIFPPIKSSVKKIDYSQDVFGISLRKVKSANVSQKASDDLDNWLQSKMPLTGQAKPLDLNSPQSFNPDTAHLYGYLKGYDPRAGFKTGIIYCSDELTRKDYPITIKFEEDGRFHTHLPLNYPKQMYLVFEKARVPVYFEPGQTVGLILNWEDFLLADRYRNAPHQLRFRSFIGPLSRINEELTAFDFPRQSYEYFLQKVKTLKPEEFVSDRLGAWDADLARLETYSTENSISTKAKAILDKEIQLRYGAKLFDYIRVRAHEATKDSSNLVLSAPLPDNYFDFLKRIGLDDPALLTGSEFSTFINRYEYMEPFEQVDRAHAQVSPPKPAKNLLEYLKEEKVPLTEQELSFLEVATKEKLTKEDIERVKADSVLSKQINTKYAGEVKAYVEKYYKPRSHQGNAEGQLKKWEQKQKVLEDSLGLEAGLAFQIAKVRSLRFWFGFMGKDASKVYWQELKQGVPQPFLVNVGDQLFAEIFPDGSRRSYELPKGTAADVFRKIIEPHKGKILFVDFWATTCGPCVGSIKRMKEVRAAHRDDPDIDFVFITDERSSPQNDYEKFVEEQEMTHTCRLNTDDFNLLRELFRFNGIPHYVVVDKGGRVLNDDFPMHNFDYELPKILANVSNFKAPE